MTHDVDVPAGTVLRLAAGEWWQQPRTQTTTGLTVTVVAVYRQVVGGRVWMQGHTCAAGECGGAWCFEGQVAVVAVQRNR
ncbi:hypothetical protein ABT336_11820 [Micromonospora sp. NPDC000207]|uniref:hypothetical protein n=1 Tax=Micromonospora sp. NPDC000207 TaxID=3154246 RepID=UPI00331F8AC7